MRYPPDSGFTDAYRITLPFLFLRETRNVAVVVLLLSQRHRRASHWHCPHVAACCSVAAKERTARQQYGHTLPAYRQPTVSTLTTFNYALPWLGGVSFRDRTLSAVTACILALVLAMPFATLFYLPLSGPLPSRTMHTSVVSPGVVSSFCSAWYIGVMPVPPEIIEIVFLPNGYLVCM